MLPVATTESKQLFVFNYDDIVFPRTDYFENTFRPYYPCINAPLVNPPYWTFSIRESMHASQRVHVYIA
jgi:hypothetical protein